MKVGGGWWKLVEDPSRSPATLMKHRNAMIKCVRTQNNGPVLRCFCYCSVKFYYLNIFSNYLLLAHHRVVFKANTMTCLTSASSWRTTRLCSRRRKKEASLLFRSMLTWFCKPNVHVTSIKTRSWNFFDANKSWRLWVEFKFRQS